MRRVPLLSASRIAFAKIHRLWPGCPHRPMVAIIIILSAHQSLPAVTVVWAHVRDRTTGTSILDGWAQCPARKNWLHSELFCLDVEHASMPSSQHFRSLSVFDDVALGAIWSNNLSG